MSTVQNVDADAFGKVETHGIDAIPAGERHGRPRELGFLWAGAFTNYASLFTASLLTTYYGLGVWDGLAANAGAQLLGGGNRVITFALVILIAAISVGVAVYGHGTIKVLETYGAVIFAALAAVLFVLLAPQFHWGQGPSVSGADYPGAFVLGFMTCFALVASWYPFASDYSRYLPSSSSTRSVTFWPLVGVSVPMVLLGLFGLLLPTIDAKLAAGQGVLAVISTHAPVWVAVPFFVFVVVGEIWANYLDVYTAGLVTLAMGIRLQRWQTALGCGILGTALAAYAVLVSDLHVAYEDFLILTYLWAPAWAAVVLLSFFVFDGKARPALALIAWVAGTATSLVFVNYVNLFGNLFPQATFFNQGMVSALHGADLSGLVGVGVAAAVYWTGRRVRAT